MGIKLFYPKKTKLKDGIAKWLAQGNVGKPSRFMAAVAIKGNSKGLYGGRAPIDKKDIGECLDLLSYAPGVEDYFNEIAKASPSWSSIIKNWDNLSDIYQKQSIQSHNKDRNEIANRILENSLKK